MRNIAFYNNNRSGDILHIQTEGCIINVRVNLKDSEGRDVTSIEILPGNYAGNGESFELDGTVNNRVIRKKD